MASNFMSNSSSTKPKTSLNEWKKARNNATNVFIELLLYTTPENKVKTETCFKNER